MLGVVEIVCVVKRKQCSYLYFITYYMLSRVKLTNNTVIDMLDPLVYGWIIVIYT